MTRYTDDLKQQIERILRWEPSSHWRLQDFVCLSELVLSHTNQWVEVPDLELFWRSSLTTPGLLNALAQFADYADWDDFCVRNQVGEMVPVKADAFHLPKRDFSPVGNNHLLAIGYCVGRCKRFIGVETINDSVL